MVCLWIELALLVWSRLDYSYDWGGRALQECNLSSQFVRRLQEKQTPVPRAVGSVFLSALLLQTRHKAKNSFSVSMQSPFIGDTVEALEVECGCRCRG